MARDFATGASRPDTLATQVYACMVRGIAVMRRRADSYVNATQILKVAGVDKGRRTKILEKEVLPGKHEIVQGGYGKYQGTWFVYFLFFWPVSGVHRQDCLAASIIRIATLSCCPSHCENLFLGDEHAFEKTSSSCP